MVLTLNVCCIMGELSLLLSVALHWDQFMLLAHSFGELMDDSHNVSNNINNEPPLIQVGP